MSATKQVILQKYGVSLNELIRKGMEAEVYAIGTDAVLKLYIGTTDFTYLNTLRNFYASLSQFALSYSLPYIQTVAMEGDICISIERQLSGTPMSAILPALTKEQMDSMMRVYLNTALELATIQVPSDFDRYKLFDAEGISRRTKGDWHQFLTYYLTQKLGQVTNYLSKDVKNLAMKVQRLYAILAQPYTGNYQIIHGDFFPGNILIDKTWHVTALLDFGLLTMYGDFLFDIATGWVFFDMYDEFKANIRERYLSIVLETLGKHVRGNLYRYVLLYSAMSANTYSPKCADGHYQWCVANLNNQKYWNNIE
jgi:hypothetical protein